MMWRRIVGLFHLNSVSPDYRPITPQSVPPAPVPDKEMALELAAGRARLDNHVASAERTVASLYHQFAAQAASNSRR